MEKRLLLAFVLSAVIFAVWSLLFPPQQPVEQPVEGAAGTASPRETVSVTDTGVTMTPGASDPSAESSPAITATVAERVETVTLGNDALSVDITNRGAAITSWELLDFRDDDGQVLELVQTVPHPDQALPLQLIGPDGVDTRMYAVERTARGVRLRWSDGLGNSAQKSIELADGGYGISVEVETRGALADSYVAIATGLRNLSAAERNSRLARWGDVVWAMDGEFTTIRRAKVKEQRVERPRSVGFVGLNDAYFLLALRPSSPIREVSIEPLAVPETGEDGKQSSLEVLRLAIRPERGMMTGELLGAPKAYDLLHDLGGGLERTLDFGLFEPISVLFLKALWWIYGRVGNYGLAIVLLTVAIRALLFPLMHTSTVSMRKMQKLQPRVKEIQARYKKKKGDPQSRAKMNQEMMALYKEEGVNPMGGCLPMLVQLPILWALYKLFLQAIELRHAPFMLWIQDLSAKDPYYITPILMTLTMWLQQRLAPQAGDPQQQRIMRMLPIVFGIMFLQFPSGLVLYWLTNNVLTIIQQEITLHLVGERGAAGRASKGK